MQAQCRADPVHQALGRRGANLSGLRRGSVVGAGPPGLRSAVRVKAVDARPGPYHGWNMSEKAKLSISLEEELGARLRAIAAQRREQISTVVTHALVDYFANEERRLDGLVAMAEYQHEHGAFTADERRAASERVDDLMGWADGAECRSA